VREKENLLRQSDLHYTTDGSTRGGGQAIGGAAAWAENMLSACANELYNFKVRVLH